MAISNRTLAALAAPFQGGGGPSHGQITMMWTAADAPDYVPTETEANKLDRVLYGLRRLRDGHAAADLPPDHVKLQTLVGDLATRLLATELVDADVMEALLAADGLRLEGGALEKTRPPDEPADRLAEFVAGLFGERPGYDIARRHFELANAAFDRSEWEAANSQLRSAFDATYNTLAWAHGCPTTKSGGQARAWLEANGKIEKDEADMLKSFSTFAGRNGSHPGLSDATDCQLRRHFATALIAFGISKLG